MKKILDFIERIFNYISAALITIMICVVLLQVFARFCLPKCPSWTEELSRFLYVHIIGFGAPVALRHEMLINVDILISHLPRKVNAFLTFLSRLVGLVICSIFAYYAYGFMMSGVIEKSVALIWPMVIPFSAMFITGVFQVIFSIELLVKCFIRDKKEEEAV